MTFFESPSRSRLLLEHDPSGRARGHAFPKTGIHPGSSPGQAFSGSCSRFVGLDHVEIRLLLHGRHAVGAREPTIEVDVRTATRAERAEVMLRRLAGDRAFAHRDGSFGHAGNVGSRDTDVKGGGSTRSIVIPAERPRIKSGAGSGARAGSHVSL